MRFRSLIAGFVLLAALVTGFVSPALAISVPTVTGLTPSGGPVKGGQVVVIKGTDFTGATAVKFGAVAATSYAVISDTNIVAVAPDAAAAGDQLVTVTNSIGTNATGKSYKYAGPTVTKVAPAWAKTDASSIITVTGTGFIGTVKADVVIGGAAALDVWVISDRSMIVKTPVTDSANSITVAEGVSDVVISRNGVASATAAGKSTFLFASGLPAITAITDGSSAVSGTDGVAVGSQLTITGTQLLGVTQVNFGATKVTAANITIASATSLTVTVPTHPSGPVDVTVETAVGASVTNLVTPFNYYSTKAPTISSLYPGVLAKGTGGTFLVYGKGFTGVKVANVELNCTTETTPVSPTSVLAVSDTAMIVVVPKVNTAGDADTCSLEVQNPVDTSLVVTKVDTIRYI